MGDVADIGELGGNPAGHTLGDRFIIWVLFAFIAANI
jgi:hypothetical protein